MVGKFQRVAALVGAKNVGPGWRREDQPLSSLLFLLVENPMSNLPSNPKPTLQSGWREFLATGIVLLWVLAVVAAGLSSLWS